MERKLYDGTRTMSQELKDSFGAFDEEGLCGCFEKIIDKGKYDEVMLANGIPPNIEKNPELLRRALAIQFKAFIDSDEEEAADIVSMTYQQLLAEPEEAASSFHHVSSLYPDDIVYIKPDHERNYEGYMYEKIEIKWKFSNLGKRTWRERKLHLANHDIIHPRASDNYIDIPETPPQTGVELTVVMELRPFQEETVCNWIMIDEAGNDCFPGGRSFDIAINVKFKRKNS